MTSRLLSTLRAEANAASDKIAWARTVCRMASHLARQGDEQNSAAVISSVRVEFKDNLHPEVACWLMLAEGIVHFCQLRPKEANDRIRRAVAISRAIGIDRAIPACTAWMAHLNFNEGNFDGMLENLRIALKTAGFDDHQAGGRAALVMADAFHFAGDFAMARPWYERCRLHAAAEGDETTMNAMLHNVAAFRASNIRLLDAFGEVELAESRRATIQAQSAYTYDAMLGGETFKLLLPLLRGQLLVVERKYVEAIAIFRKINFAELHSRLTPILQIDISWSLSNLNNITEATNLLNHAISIFPLIVDFDDKAYFCSRAAQTAAICNKLDIVNLWRTEAATALSAHKSTQASLLIKLLELGSFPKNDAIFRPETKKPG